MLKINDKSINIDFNGVKIIQCDNPNKIIKNFFSNNFLLEINNDFFLDENTFIIYDFTKFNDLFSMNKNSKIHKLIIEKILKEINEEYYDILEQSEGSIDKLISMFFNLKKNDFLNKDDFIFFIKHYFKDKKITFILNNIDWIKINDIKPYINYHNFIILTNNFRNNISNINDLETLFISDLKLNGVEILDKHTIINYLEKELNVEINDFYFNSFIKNFENYEYEKLFFYIKNIKNL